MAINVNTAYKTALSILNKEQRGYLTPDEFNFDSNNYDMYIDTDSSSGGINIITRY